MPHDRPTSLIADLPPGALKERLTACLGAPVMPTEFSIAHRGAPLGYPEHTREGYVAAAEMGAEWIECDVTFTKDLALVCRHSQCDLHRTTDILATPLAKTCRTPFAPATVDRPAAAECCTADLSAAEFLSLCGRPDHVNGMADSVADYLARYAPPVDASAPSCGTLMTHAESIALIDELDRDFVPELKAPMVEMPFAGLSRKAFATALLDEYRDAGVDPARVHPQSFDPRVVRFWQDAHPDFAQGAVFLDGRGRLPDFVPTLEGMQALYEQGLRTIAPPIPMLLDERDGELVASDYARYARRAGLDIVTWTLERGPVADPTNPSFSTYEVLHALAREAGVMGVFSDWPETVTFYANCMTPRDATTRPE